MFPDLFRDDVFRIETRRLWLRWPTARDAGAITRLAGDRAVAEMTARIPHPLERRVVDAFLLEVRGANLAGTGLTLAIADRAAPGRLIGLVGIALAEGGEAPHLGYWLGRERWGTGLMSEAAAALVHAYFAWAGGTRLIAEARVDNPASRRVLERAGFVAEGRTVRSVPLRGGDHAVDCFRLDRAGWLAAAAPVPAARAA
ncbi:GNAT family N-acetyltransferase [Methylobacterium sp. NEAU 140]|uniref:GNAT family N-acetyltransferase n=1 Tax=Methylobacterium sp. NEAU 140 TaxID=3064945 RepID=UPI002733FCC5|nr:GNAT family N-acetyltransferase [Methylobacterium sp. NEAU 140]MDP4023073.1 GNAT family N-acetyltransferase [Methylobacterium sp. NEAU 140]